MGLFKNLLLKILSHYFRLAKIPEQLKKLIKDDTAFTLVTQSDSLVMQGLLDSVAKRLDLLGQKYVTGLGEQDTHFLSWVCLHDEQNLELTAKNYAQKFINKEKISTGLYTLNIFSGRGPTRDRPSNRLSLIDQIGMVLMRRFLVVVLGDEVRVPTENHLNSKRLIRALKVELFKSVKLVRGTPFQPIEMQAKNIFAGQEFEKELAQIAEKSGWSKSKALREIKSSFYDMAANPRRPIYWLLGSLAKFVVNRLFTQVVTQGLDRFTNAAKDHTVVLAPIHRSHLDYIILGHKLYDSNLNPPIVAAGVNLRFWPIGFFIRSVGAFFVKRNSRGDRLHTLILKRYVTYLVKRGHLQEFFIEGGRSRSGKMRQPKLGLLNIIINAQLQNIKDNILLVPVSISYENILEDKSFGRENAGSAKDKEDFWALLKVWRIFKRKYGDVVISFGEAISLSNFIKTHEQRQIDHLASGEKTEGDKSLAQELAHLLTNQIRSYTNPSLTNLAYTALMMAPRYGLPREELVKQIMNLASLAQIMRTVNNKIGDNTPTLQSFISDPEKTGLISDIARSGIAQTAFFGRVEVFFVPGKQRFTADFYKNTAIHVFFPIGLLSLLQLLEGEVTINRAMQFYDLFKTDFLLPVANDFKNELEELISKLIVQKVLKPKDDKSKSYEFSSLEDGIFIPALLQGSIQSILWVYQTLLRLEGGTQEYLSHEKTGQQVSQVLNYAESLESMLKDFKTAVYLGVLHRTEASSTSAISSALDALNDAKAIGYAGGSLGDPKTILVFKDSAEILNLLWRANHAINQWQNDLIEKKYRL